MKRMAGGMLALAVWALGGAAVSAQAPAAPPPVTAPQASVAQASGAQGHPLTRADLESWLDGVMAYNLAQNGMAGGEVVIVSNGQILFQKGYGWADVARRRPVDVERTLFRPGSISKLFAWTAVMQQVELGRLDLDADVNRYLDFKLAHPPGRPITLRLLMTHRAGFEEHLKGMMAPDVASIRPLGQFLRDNPPARLSEPGTVPAYSNWGAALAGYIVERVSHEPFNDYVARHIFAPLDMQRSTFQVPPQPALKADLSQGYLTASGPPQHFELDQLQPAGSMSATGPDMAHFMIAHLQDGRYGATSILRPETARLMHATASQPMPPLTGMGLGIFQGERNGHRILEHGGNSQFFFAHLTMLPDDGAGIYLAFNTAGRRDPLALEGDITDAFIDRYFPAGPQPAEPTTSTAAEHARMIAGLYESSRRAQSSFASIIYVLLQQVQVTANSDGTITAGGPLFSDGKARTMREVAPFVWREVGGSERLGAKVEGGRITMIGTDRSNAETVYQPVPALRASTWNLPLFVGALAVLLITAVSWPIGALVRRALKGEASLTGRALWVRRAAKATAVLVMVYVAGWAMIFQMMLNDLSVMNAGLDPQLRVLQAIGLLITAGAGAALWNLWLAFGPGRSWAARAGAVLLAVACLDVVWVSFAFHLITASLSY